ncbi:MULTISPECIES: copper resistance CopC family protein [unclassified Pseudoalteromonas]|uniref:copper resistance CopC family protein n=1 Tax=unclassified Pseudoalteromonas TaxID=194690 RepID=UPI0003FCEB50|nr:copper resistance CopC family protein [Pseudoalteromonas sp. S8-38]MAY57624.1 copper resistance protein CopC [Pseudoalteromonas sp.]|tara:strand:+ start:1294 stop:1701 length:408 start_codon:yes stop_codon:yes gene_type:complete
MKFFNSAVAILGLVLTFSASAHISLKQSTPAQEAMLMKSPEQLSLTFGGEVRLAKVIIKDEKNKSINFDFKPSSTPSTDFNWSLPSLAHGTYTVKWTVLGGDGHKMSDSFSFMVHQSESSNMMQEQSNAHSKHNH